MYDAIDHVIIDFIFLIGMIMYIVVAYVAYRVGHLNGQIDRRMRRHFKMDDDWNQWSDYE